MMKQITFIIFGIISLLSVDMATSQEGTVKLTNPSFEDVPKRGERSFFYEGIRNWYDCGLRNFPGETPPDIHPGPNGFWGNFKESFNGNTYLGMVVRQNDSWESVSQELSQSFKAGQCYEFSAILARNEVYLSAARPLGDAEPDPTEVPFTTPIVLRIWAGYGHCDTQELLAESPAISNNNWQEFYFKVKPTKNYDYITLEAFYKVPVFEPYNGHILIDGLSHFVPIECPSRTDIYAVETKDLEVAPEDTDLADHSKPIQNKTSPQPQSAHEIGANPKAKKPANVEKPTASPQVTHEPKILTDLDAKTIKKGQVIEIKNLFFMADSTEINHSSHEVLDEVYSFLRAHPSVKVEIGGHTNGIPDDDYCLKLSRARATSVASYLKNKGIDERRIVTKGYGKSKPIASNKTIVGRKRNQRVEIKILET